MAYWIFTPNVGNGIPIKYIPNPNGFNKISIGINIVLQ